MVALKSARAGRLTLAVCGFAFAVIVAFWSAAVIVTNNDRARTLAETDESNRNLALTLSEHAARTFDYADRIALQVKERHERAARGFDLERMGRDGAINRKIVVGVAITDAQGELRQMDVPLTRAANVADREHFQAHKNGDSGKPIVSRPLASRVLERPSIIVLSRRLNRPDGSFDGIVSVAIDPDVFTGFYSHIGLGDKGLIVLTGLDGYTRARSSGGRVDGGAGQDVRKGPLFPHYATSDAGVVRYQSVVDHIDRRVAFRKLENYPIVMSVGVAEETVLALVNARARTAYLGALFASVLALIAAAALLLMVRRREHDSSTLRESEARYRGLLDTLPDAVFIRRDDRIVYVNAAALRLFGAQSPAQLLGKTPYDIIHPDFHERVRSRIDSLKKGDSSGGVYEQQYMRLDGSVVDVEVSVALIHDGGAVVRQVVSRDITVRKRAEAALRETTERYRQMVEASPDATFINRGDEIVFANAAALRLLGATDPAQVLGKSPLEVVHPDDRATARKRIASNDAGIATPGLFEQRFLRLDGSAVETELSTSLVVDQSGLARQVVARDITSRKKIEAALRDSETTYRLLMESLPDAVLIYEDDRVAYVNATAVKMLGAESAEQLVGRTLYELVHPGGHAAALARREYVVKTGQPTGLFEQIYVRMDGSTVEVEGSSILMPGPTRQRLIAVRDVSARKRAEAALGESEARLRMAVEAAGMTNWEWDLASGQMHWGFGHERLLGPLPAGAVQYPDFREMVHAEDREHFLAAGRATVEHGVPYDIEFRFIRTDGALRWMRHTGRALHDSFGRVEGISGVMQDATRSHDIERELDLSRRRREALMESIPAPAWLKDRAGRFVATNRAWCERFQFDAAYAIGLTNSDLFPKEYAEKREREDQLVFETRTEQRIEREAVIDGKACWIETVKTPVFDEYGNVSGIVGVSYDTTARKRAEAELRASEERFRLFAESVDEVFWIIEPDPLRVLYVNQAFAEIWGVPVADLLANSRLWYESIHPDDQAANLAAFAHWLEDPASDDYDEEYRIVRADGAVRWIRDHGTKMCDANGRVYRLHGIAEDITEQRRAEQALAESQQRRDALLESNPDPSWLKDCDSRYIAANGAWFKRHGLQPHNIAGKVDEDFFDAARAVILRKEDQIVIATRAVTRQERNWGFADEVEWVETVKAPVFDSAGRVVAVVGISHDISERKRGEQAVQLMNESLAQKTDELTVLNRELESFAYTVSHDLRAPLRHIDGFINLLKLHAGPTLDAQSTRYFERVTHAARRMGMLIDDLLAFSRTGRAEMRSQRVVLAGLLRETIEQFAPDTRGRSVEWLIGALPEVQGDAGLLAIVFQNLIGNAIKYTRPREHAKIEIREIDGDRGMVTLIVRDNGVGFDMKYLPKLFGVFQRLHADSEFEGTGIGLATVARIVQRHGGRVWADAVEGEGCCFYIALPRARREAQVA